MVPLRVPPRWQTHCTPKSTIGYFLVISECSLKCTCHLPRFDRRVPSVTVFFMLLLRSWGSSPALASSCWSPPPSSSWPRPSSSAASANAAKATTTRCRPKGPLYGVGADQDSSYLVSVSFLHFPFFFVFFLLLPPALRESVVFPGWTWSSHGRFGSHRSA